MNHRTAKQAGFTLIELIATISIIGIVGTIISTTVLRAKAKANRVKCLNNLSQIGKALISFGHSHEDRLPWQMLEGEKKLYFGEHYDENSSAIFGILPLKAEIQGPRILHSPCDSGRVAFSKEAQTNWEVYDTKKGMFIPSEAISYDLIKGGDITKPTTMLGVTRNLYSRELHKSRWVGSDGKKVLMTERKDPPLPSGMDPRLMRHGPGWDGPGPWLGHIRDNLKKYPYGGARSSDLLHKFGKKSRMSHVINGLNEGEGHVLMADGSVKKSTNSDLGFTGTLVKPHLRAHQIGSHYHALKAGLGEFVPKRRNIFLKDGTVAPRSKAIAMREENPAIVEWEYDHFRILGDEEFYTYVTSEIELLKNEVPEIYNVAKKHVTTFNCTGINGTYAIISPRNGWVNISRGVFNRNPDEVEAPNYVDAPWHTLVFIHEIQHCDVDSCTSQGAANYAAAYYGRKMKIHSGWINFVGWMASAEGYNQEKWDYHHSPEFAKNRIPYEEYIKKSAR